jgi:hypothetical protein
MNWEAIGAVAESIGGLGVIASLIYLAIQIQRDRLATQQNTTQLRANSARDMYLASTNQDLAPVLSRLQGDHPSPGAALLMQNYNLELEDAWKVNAFYNAYLRTLEANLRMPMSEQEREQTLRLLANTMSRSALGPWWEQSRNAFAPDFVAQIDSVHEETTKSDA